MVARSTIIRDAYRVALADWARRDIAGLPSDGSLLSLTASIASTFANSRISTEDVIQELGANRR